MPIRGHINLPGDKSISHRALLIASILDGENYIYNLSTAIDVNNTMQCLNQIGIKSSRQKNNVVIKGNTFISSQKTLDCGNSGTTMRLLSGLLGGLNISSKLIGDKSLLKRPMDRIVNPLKNMGIKISCNNNTAPITIKESEKLNGLNYNMNISSAQIKSALLLAGVSSNNKITINEQYPSRNHTEIMLKNIGYNINVTNNTITLHTIKHNLKNLDIHIPGDISSAAFFIGAACMIPNSDLKINNVLINDTRMGFIEILKKMGAGIIIHNQKNVNGESVGDIQVYYKPLYGIDIDDKNISSMIDELPILAVVATQAEGITTVSGAKELRYKESDRIKTTVENLKNMGAKIIEKNDGLIIEGPNILNKANIKCYNDHRIAMSFIIAGISSGNYNNIDNIDCINTSYPEFIDTLKKIIR